MPRGAGLTDGGAAPKRTWPLLLAAAFVFLFAFVYVWRVKRDIPKIQSEKQAEGCRQQLRIYYNAESSYYGEYDKYDPAFITIGIEPEIGRSALIGSDTGTWSRGRPTVDETGVLGDVLTDAQVGYAIGAADVRGTSVGVKGTCPSCSMTMLCITQLDDDDTMDVWSVSTIDRTRAGMTIARGEPLHDIDDAVE